jgi:hypothetical protein
MCSPVVITFILHNSFPALMRHRRVVTDIQQRSGADQRDGKVIVNLNSTMARAGAPAAMRSSYRALFTHVPTLCANSWATKSTNARTRAEVYGDPDIPSRRNAVMGFASVSEGAWWPFARACPASCANGGRRWVTGDALIELVADTTNYSLPRTS